MNKSILIITGVMAVALLIVGTGVFLFIRNRSNADSAQSVINQNDTDINSLNENKDFEDFNENDIEVNDQFTGDATKDVDTLLSDIDKSMSASNPDTDFAAFSDADAGN